MVKQRSFAYIGVFLLVFLAGCSAAGSLHMKSAPSDSKLAEQASRPVIIPNEEPTEDQLLVQQAITDGSATSESPRPAVEPGLPFVYNRTYYNISSTIIDHHSETQVTVGIDYNGTAPPSKTITYDRISKRDQVVLSDLFPPKTDTYRPGPDIGTSTTYNATEWNNSVILKDNYTAVRYQEETYPVILQDTQTVRVNTYQYTATIHANDSDEYADELRSKYLFTLSGLSKSEQNIVEKAINDTYYADSTEDDAFRSVLETFQNHRAIQKTEYRGKWLVRYEGRVYVAELSYDGFTTTS